MRVNFPSPLDFGTGDSPSISLVSPSKVVEENADQFADLYYRVGNVVNNSVAWGKAVPLDGGSEPSLATNGASTVVSVFSANGGKGLNYRVGTLAGDSINWGPAYPYEHPHFDYISPQVAFSGSDTVVEVDQAGESGEGQLSYIVGRVDGQGISFGNDQPDGAGYNESVAADANGNVITVRSTGDILRYSLGTIDDASKTIKWKVQSAPIPGTSDLESPTSVTWSPNGYIVVAYVCDAAYPFDDLPYLCTVMGTLNADSTISWYGLARSYVIKATPNTLSVALNGESAVAAVGFRDKETLQYATSLLSDRANWEGDGLETYLKGRTLHYMIFPASHDAGMYVDYSGGLGAEALAQDQNLYEQLQGGERYFDLRPDYNFRFYHGPVDGAKVQDGLDDVAKFMREGHREVVILKFSHFDFHSGDYAKLLNMVSTTLSSWLYVNNTGKRLADVPLSTLLGNGHGVVLPLIDVAKPTGKAGIYTYRDYQSQDDPQGGQFTAFDQWSDKESFDNMEKDQLSKYEKFDGKMEHDPSTPCDLFLLSWTLTPVSEVYSVAPNADSELGPVMATIKGNPWNQIPNILYVDFYEWADPADVAITMNARLVHYVGPAHRQPRQSSRHFPR